MAGTGVWIAIKPDRVDTKSAAFDVAGIWNTPADRGGATALVVGNISAFGAAHCCKLTARTIGHSKGESDIGLLLDVNTERCHRERIDIAATRNLGA